MAQKLKYALFITASTAAATRPTNLFLLDLQTEEFLHFHPVLVLFAEHKFFIVSIVQVLLSLSRMWFQTHLFLFGARIQWKP